MLQNELLLRYKYLGHPIRQAPRHSGNAFARFAVSCASFPRWSPGSTGLYLFSQQSHDIGACGSDHHPSLYQIYKFNVHLLRF